MVTKFGRATLRGQPLFQWAAVLIIANRQLQPRRQLGSGLLWLGSKNVFAEIWVSHGFA